MIVIGDATLYQGDCLDVLKTLPDCSVDAVVTDPPYALSFMGRAGQGIAGSGDLARMPARPEAGRALARVRRDAHASPAVVPD